MKKLFLIFLCAVLLSLCGCEQIGYLVSKPAGSSAASSAGTAHSSAPVSSAQTVTSSERSSAAASASSVPASSAVSSAVSSALPKTVTVTVPEGYSMVQIFKLLEENNVCSFDKLMAKAASYDYTYYPLIGAIQKSDARCFTLEGYLFPDTYEFYTNQKPENAIGIFLRNAEKKLSDSLRKQAADRGYSMDELLTLASIIEKECGKKSEMKNVSAVLHNRLNKGMKLQCDVTINYVERYLKPYISGDVNRYNSYYNTYKCAALPSGPICNPGMTAINAALTPSDTDALYFVTDAAGNYYYAADYETHQQNCQTAGVPLN